MKKVIVEYETSFGLQTKEFEGENIVPDIVEDRGVIYIEEILKDKPNNILAIINLKSFVSFRIEEIEQV